MWPNAGENTCLSSSRAVFFKVTLAFYLGEGNGTPLEYSCLENPMDGGAWQATVHGVTTNRIPLSHFTFTFHFHALEKEMATHSSVLAWRIPGTGEPGGLPSMESHRVRHDWSDLATAVLYLGVMDTRFLLCRKNLELCPFLQKWMFVLLISNLHSTAVSVLCANMVF